MTRQKINLPPRKWYSLQQGADKLSQETNQIITSGDLLHYANQGLLELSVRIDFENINNEEFKLNIHNSNLNNVLNDLYDIDIHCWQGYKGKTDFLKTERFKAILRDEFDFEKFFEQMKEDCLMSEDGLSDSEEVFSKVNEIPTYNGLVNNEYDIDIRTNIEKLNGFFAIDFNDFEEIFIDEQNPIINLETIAFRPSRADNIENEFGFVIGGRDFHKKQIITLNKDSIFIVPEELEFFIKGGKPIRNLNSFESFIEEWEKPTRIINPTSIKKENVLLDTGTVKIFELNEVPYYLKAEAKNEEFEEIQAKKNKGGRPSKNKDKIIELARKIFERYPNRNRDRIAEAVVELINNKNYLKENFEISLVTVRKYLKENNIGKYRGESNPIRNLEQFL
ncbi:hypothetical protein ACIRXL_04915 [Avibacterium paragallinarum]|uniref:hypothetical protein n=1 Tax=Avibacterium paragallinarum TaxID=728 RepID=UPI0021F73AF0|nr:hypothetical protein [Avibacterium paragallinarum]UXN34890.1 hypothetical protein N8E86_01265 [Avibacterium paragallinarum]